MSPRPRVVLLTLVVVLAVVQPTLADAGTADADPGAGDVGTTFGPAVERHPSSAGATADALRTVRADRVHERGLTGSGVAVGVVGQGFDSGAVDSSVVDRRQVGEPTDSTAHDTAVAEVVAETAPDADLYLVGVGRTPTPAEYAAAVEWLTARGVDVVVDSGSYFPAVAADERRITAAAERATERDVVFVTSAGNYADRHWAGAGTDDGWIDFAADDAANALADGDAFQGRVTVRLRWRSDADYDLYLYRRLPNAPDRVVAKSTGDEAGPGLTVEGIDVAVPRGQYYVAAYADDPPDTPDRVQVFAARHELEHTTASGSMVAPATSERVVAVGAAEDGEHLAYSSRSATGTVDLTAPADAGAHGTPDLAGTSAAAPYVAGTAALVKEAGGDPSPARVETVLRRTADDDGETVDALAAVEAVTASEAAGSDVDVVTSETPVAGSSGDVGRSRTDPDRLTTGDATSATSNAVDRSATRNVSESDGRGTAVETDDDERTARPDERNRNDGADRTGERDRDRDDNSTDSDSRVPDDGSTDGDGRRTTGER